jgi:hypothetical protein
LIAVDFWRERGRYWAGTGSDETGAAAEGSAGGVVSAGAAGTGVSAGGGGTDSAGVSTTSGESVMSVSTLTSGVSGTLNSLEGSGAIPPGWAGGGAVPPTAS